MKKNYKNLNEETVNGTYILKKKKKEKSARTHTPTNYAWFLDRSASLRMDEGEVKLWVAVAESGALSGSTNTVAWMFVPLYFAITWFSPPSASAAAASWRSSEPWSSRWKWQSSRPWPAPPSQTPTTASSHPEKPQIRVDMLYFFFTLVQANSEYQLDW